MTAPSSLFSDHYLPLHLQLHLTLVGKHPPNLITTLSGLHAEACFCYQTYVQPGAVSSHH
jgi:hypothetical protein